MKGRSPSCRRTGRHRQFRHLRQAENKWYLIGNVTLTQGTTVTQGDRLIYDLGGTRDRDGRRPVFTPKDSASRTPPSRRPKTIAARAPGRAVASKLPSL